MSDKELAILASLNEVEGLRGKLLSQLYQYFGNFERIWAGADRLENIGVGREVAGKVRAHRRARVEESICARYAEMGVYMVPFDSKYYPIQLRNFSGMPMLLYVKGDRKLLEAFWVAVVGSRRVSAMGGEKVNRVVTRMQMLNRVQHDGGVGVVSGLAAGIDSLAQAEALRSGLQVAAVLAHGLDMVYPEMNSKLCEEILRRGGVVVSEHPLGVKPKPEYFLARNRLVVGMSQAVIVVEGRKRSGTEASANLAAEMGVEVWAVPGSELTDELIAEGAAEIAVNPRG